MERPQKRDEQTKSIAEKTRKEVDRMFVKFKKHADAEIERKGVEQSYEDAVAFLHRLG